MEQAATRPVVAPAQEPSVTPAPPPLLASLPFSQAQLKHVGFAIPLSGDVLLTPNILKAVSPLSLKHHGECLAGSVMTRRRPAWASTAGCRWVGQALW